MRRFIMMVVCCRYRGRPNVNRAAGGDLTTGIRRRELDVHKAQRYDERTGHGEEVLGDQSGQDALQDADGIECH